MEIFNQGICDSPTADVVARTVESFGAVVAPHLWLDAVVEPAVPQSSVIAQEQAPLATAL